MLPSFSGAEHSRLLHRNIRKIDCPLQSIFINFNYMGTTISFNAILDHNNTTQSSWDVQLRAIVNSLSQALRSLMDFDAFSQQPVSEAQISWDSAIMRNISLSVPDPPP